MSSYDTTLAAIAPERNSLINHRLYDLLDSAPAMRCFMQSHVFAVWDFMSLLKALQQQLTCVHVPWTPQQNAPAVRLVNEIVLAEESDVGCDGHPASHYEMYLTAMLESGADTAAISEFTSRLSSGISWRQALAGPAIPTAVVEFTSTTLTIAESGNLCEIAGAFTFAREQLLPDVFDRIVTEINADSGGRFSALRYYLNRHIELDGDEHGAMAQQLMESLCTSEEKWRMARDAALESLAVRRRLWDHIADEIGQSATCNIDPAGEPARESILSRP